MNTWQELKLLLKIANKARRSRTFLRMSREEIQALQRKKFQQLVARVFSESPFYRQVIQARNINITDCSPEDFPVLTKSEVFEHFDHIVTDPEITRDGLAAFLEHSKNPRDLFLGKYYACHSSGSSGISGFYVYSQEEFLEGTLSMWRATDFRLHKRLAFVGVGHSHCLGPTMTMAARRLRFIYDDVRTFDVNAPFAATIAGLNQMQPTDLSAYAFTLRKLAEAQEEKKLCIRPRFLQSSAEPLSAADKAFIERVFQAPVTILYASTEHLVMGLGADRLAGTYLMDDSLIFELLPEAVRVTSLYNCTLPLIRYEIPDLIRLDPSAAPGTPFTKIQEIVGRIEDAPVFINDHGEKDFINPHVLRCLYAKNLRDFQMQPVGDTAFIFNVRLEAGLADEQKQTAIQGIRHRLAELLSQKEMTRVTFEIQLVEELQIDARSGKLRLILPPRA